ncbi:DUF2777 family protein [Thalassorhabdus alkalitolerans]|uniref:DUF2777 family protein n=1 Tax=Thalassorhabdus alkalitolerans TaxID=2282697 RepID=A0ABW0YR91_9BACI
MNRAKASQYKGQTIVVDEGKMGSYFGILTNIDALPNKPWMASVRITGIQALPASADLHEPMYLEGEVVECLGTKVKEPENEYTGSYESSFIDALQKKGQWLQEKTAQYTSFLHAIEKKLQFYNASLTNVGEIDQKTEDESFVYYSIVKVNDILYLQEDTRDEQLELEGCPFTLEIEYKHQWIKCTPAGGLSFLSENGKLIPVSEGARVRISRQQFEPFTILLNELEQPSRQSLEKGLRTLGFTEKDLVKCHNRLLHELLARDAETSFQGVNFLMFQKNSSTLIVQHHYERTLQQNSPDSIFDRFEFTTDQGARSIITYSNALSK